MKNGWIKLYRKLRDSEIWAKEYFDKRSAWIDLLLRATHTEEKFLIGNTIIQLEPGQIFTSEKGLAKNWKWSRHKVRNFFILLEQIGQIGTPIRTSKYTILTIANWELYQSDNSKKDTNKDISGTSKGHQKDTFKNVKNVKNDKNIYSIFIFWNSLKIQVHKNIETKIGKQTYKTCIKKSLETYTCKEITEAMQNYKTIIADKINYIPIYRWTLGEFLIRGLEKFLTVNNPFENYNIDKWSGNRKTKKQEDNPPYLTHEFKKED